MNWERVSKYILSVLPSRIKEPLKPLLGVPSIKKSLLNLHKNRVEINNFIDVGAYKGDFSLLIKSIWPDSRGLMLEGNPALETHLIKIAEHNDNLQYKIALLSSVSEIETNFYLSDTASSILKTHTGGESPVLLRSLTLDRICNEREINKNIDLLKLDVQGYELEVLKGGTSVLQNTKYVLMEVSLLDIYVDSPLVRDIINYMFEFGFVLYDICSVDIRRPLDNALWQTDFLFVKSDSILREKKSYF